MKRVGIDVGGTFTDVILVDEATDRIWATKVPTTPHDPSIGADHGVRKVLEMSGLSGGDVEFLGHGTTIATNMVIEGKGARTALLTTAGFRDIIEIRRASRHDRADLYDLFFDNPPPLVPRALRRGIRERVLYDGTVEREIDKDQLDEEIRDLADEGVEAVAVCFLNSHINPTHERIVTEEFRRRNEAVFVTASFEVNPEAMEYERTCTTVLNAMLGPRCGHYLRTFEKRARDAGLAADTHFMQSNGGLTKTASAAQRPVTLLASGPAGGVTAGARICERLGLPNAILGDMGGTSFDVSLVRNWRPEVRNEAMLNTFTVRCPNLDIVSIGAGGGSIAWVDEASGVRIGPASAGADPGPACYGRGAERPTVTDCNLLLGYLDPKTFLGGEFELHVEAAEAAVWEHLARPLGVSVTEAALTVRVVANALMAQAIRLLTVERGYDPRDFVYLPYGGAGPVHAVDLARDLEIPTVVVPQLPGLFSAYGMLVADLLHDLQAAVVATLDEVEPAALERRYGELEAQAAKLLREVGVDPSLVEMRRRADCAYLAQAETLQVEIPSGALSAETVSRIGRDFETEHKRHWNFVQPDRPIRLVNIRVQAVGKIGSFRNGAGQRSQPARRVEARGDTRIYLGGRWCNVARYMRQDLRPGQELAGPALVEEQSSAVLIESADRLRVDDGGNLIITIGMRS